MLHIDAHQHFWNYDPGEYEWIDDSMKVLRRDFLPNDLKPELECNGFDACIAVQARQTLEETRWLLELADHHSFIAAVVGWVDLQSAHAEKQLRSLAENPKLAGVRHIVQSEPDERFMLRADFMRGIALLEHFDLAYDILIYPQHLPVAAELIRQFERQRFVLDHLAKPQIRSGELTFWSHGIRDLATFQNVFCKLSGLVTEAHWQNWKPEDFRPYLDVAFECFGANRLMIGSDWPVCTVAGDYSRVMDIVRAYIEKIPAVARDAVMGGTARRFYRCKDGSTSLSSL